MNCSTSNSWTSTAVLRSARFSQRDSVTDWPTHSALDGRLRHILAKLISVL
ncbi:MAG: hypothetical protein M9963_08900 [Kiritimatiellae bacterium]|nr:hypothetical protein [Kiritimatiellia bacterium]